MKHRLTFELFISVLRQNSSKFSSLIYSFPLFRFQTDSWEPAPVLSDKKPVKQSAGHISSQFQHKDTEDNHPQSHAHTHSSGQMRITRQLNTPSDCERKLAPGINTGRTNRVHTKELQGKLKLATLLLKYNCSSLLIHNTQNGAISS